MPGHVTSQTIGCPDFQGAVCHQSMIDLQFKWDRFRGKGSKNVMPALKYMSN